MCGVCGVIGPERRAASEHVEAMARSLAHRGPDDQGMWTARFRERGEPFALGLGHTRLAILDLSPAGHQPMHDAEGGLALVYNGEVYNFRVLREELEALGFRFASGTDTEVILAAFRAWDLEAFARMNGMFALAVWDATRQRLVLARDRLGIKPLHYHWRDDLLLFGSELSALRTHPRFRPEIDPAALGLFLRHKFVPGPRTIYRDTYRLMPGEYLVWEAGRIRTGTWWSLTDSPEAGAYARSFEEAVDHLESLLADAIEQRLISDVPLGAFLSGGIDSSTVVALMKRRARGKVRTFSIGFRDARYDEAPYAKAVAEHLGTEHTELYVSTKQAAEVARELPVLYDEPFADPSAIPTVLLARLTRDFVTVALSGDGGDELFGGYWQYPKLQALLPWMAAPHVLRRAGAGLARWLPSGRARNALLHLRSADPAELAYSLVSALSPATLRAVCGPEGATPNAVWLEAFRTAPPADAVLRAMRADARVYLADDILTKVDRATMSVGLEARVPLLDERVVRFAARLPLSLHWNGGRTKAPLRALLHRHVPPRLVERPKRGFGLPMAGLLGAELETWRRRYLEPARLREEGHLDPAGVERALAEARRKGDRAVYDDILWSLLSFQRWFAHHHRGEGGA